MIEWFDTWIENDKTIQGVQTFDSIHVIKLEGWKIKESRYLSSLTSTHNNILVCDNRITYKEVELYSEALDKKALGYEFTMYVVELGLYKTHKLICIAGESKLDSLILMSTLLYLLTSGATMQEKMRIV